MLETEERPFSVNSRSFISISWYHGAVVLFSRYT